MLDTLQKNGLRQVGGVPDDAVPAKGFNSTEIDGTTVRSILAAPGSGQSYYLTEIVVTNRTASEAPVITVQDDTGTPVPLITVSPGAPGTAPGGTIIHKFEPPLKVGDNKAVNGKAASAVGDTTVFVNGFVGAA